MREKWKDRRIIRLTLALYALTAAVWTANAVLGIRWDDLAALRTACAVIWWLAFLGNVWRFRRQRAGAPD